MFYRTDNDHDDTFDNDTSSLLMSVSPFDEEQPEYQEEDEKEEKGDQQQEEVMLAESEIQSAQAEIFVIDPDSPNRYTVPSYTAHTSNKSDGIHLFKIDRTIYVDVDRINPIVRTMLSMSPGGSDKFYWLSMLLTALDNKDKRILDVLLRVYMRHMYTHLKRLQRMNYKPEPRNLKYERMDDVILELYQYANYDCQYTGHDSTGFTNANDRISVLTRLVPLFANNHIRVQLAGQAILSDDLLLMIQLKRYIQTVPSWQQLFDDPNRRHGFEHLRHKFSAMKTCSDKQWHALYFIGGVMAILDDDMHIPFCVLQRIATHLQIHVLPTLIKRKEEQPDADYSSAVLTDAHARHAQIRKREPWLPIQPFNNDSELLRRLHITVPAELMRFIESSLDVGQGSIRPYDWIQAYSCCANNTIMYNSKQEYEMLDRLVYICSADRYPKLYKHRERCSDCGKYHREKKDDSDNDDNDNDDDDDYVDDDDQNFLDGLLYVVDFNVVDAKIRVRSGDEQKRIKRNTKKKWKPRTKNMNTYDAFKSFYDNISHHGSMIRFIWNGLVRNRWPDSIGVGRHLFATTPAATEMKYLATTHAQTIETMDTLAALIVFIGCPEFPKKYVKLWKEILAIMSIPVDVVTQVIMSYLATQPHNYTRPASSSLSSLTQLTPLSSLTSSLTQLTSLLAVPSTQTSRLSSTMYPSEHDHIRNFTISINKPTTTAVTTTRATTTSTIRMTRPKTRSSSSTTSVTKTSVPTTVASTARRTPNKRNRTNTDVETITPRRSKRRHK